MRRLAAQRGESVDRRFTQLLSVGPDALPHYVRQAVQLLRAENIPLDFHQLAHDLVRLLNTNAGAQGAHPVRLSWARDYHRPDHSPNPAEARTDIDETETAPTT